MDSIEIQTVSGLNALVEVPPSKSYTNRALIVAALADGESVIENHLFSDDTNYMSRALRQYGLPVIQGENTVTVKGGVAKLCAPTEKIFVGNAGTTMRFLTTFAALASGETRLTGDERMQERPIADLLTCLRSMGVDARSVKNNRCPPVLIRGGIIHGGEVGISGDQSSQYITSILLCAPYFQNDTQIKIVGELTSKSYVDITLDIMRTFGATIKNDQYQAFQIPSGQRYTPRTYRIEGDATSASYFLAAAAVAGGEVAVTGLNPESVQGDNRFTDVLAEMGCRVEKSAEKIVVRRNELHGTTINMNTMPDTVQTLAVTALFAKGETTITGIGNLRLKETDRITALVEELSRLGAEVKAGRDFLWIKPADSYRGAEIETYNDHRMAMSFSLAGLKIPGVTIKNPKCVGKSFPDFFERFQTLYERS